MNLDVTLDTNCIINLLDDKSVSRTSYIDLSYILSLISDGLISGSVTTRFNADQSNDLDLNRVRRIASALAELPIETIGSGFRLNVSSLNGRDFLGDDELIMVHNKLVNILSPTGLRPEANTFTNRLYDIDHLISHYFSSNEFFITDDKGILKNADKLENDLSMRVVSPSSYAKYSRMTNMT